MENESFLEEIAELIEQEAKELTTIQVFNYFKSQDKISLLIKVLPKLTLGNRQALSEILTAHKYI